MGEVERIFWFLRDEEREVAFSLTKPNKRGCVFISGRIKGIIPAEFWIRIILHVFGMGNFSIYLT